jgi:hypothetical protein
MTSRAEVYRSKAVECEREGARAATLPLKRKYRDLAHQWRGMAEEAERANVRGPKKVQQLEGKITVHRDRNRRRAT